MESMIGIETSSEVRFDGIGEKRLAAEDVDVLREEGDLEPPVKRSRGSELSLAGGVEVKKVAEMVLVLAAMGKMRGGKSPTIAEKELMVEARDRLGKICEGFAPKDVFPRNVFGRVIEDLGLHKLKDQRIGLRPPKLSIADKLLVSKRKMEKADDFSQPPTPHLSQHLQRDSGAAVESFSASHPVQMSQLAKPNHVLAAPGNFRSISSSGQVPISNSTSLPYQLPTSEIRPIVSTALPMSHMASATSTRVAQIHLKSDGRSNGSTNPSQVQANYSANSTVRTPTWSVQPQTVVPAKIGPDGKMPVNISLKVDGAADITSGLPTQATSRTVVAQTARPWSQGTNYVQSSAVGNAHAEIGKIVQKLLQPRNSERPTWNPPSREYMSKALTCQVCMSTVIEIDSVLICDACEKGYHLKCLQTINEKVVLRGEWHCGKCLSLSNGKPLPPKYGRVMRNTNNSTTGLSTPSKKVGASDENVNQSKITTNGNTSMPNVPIEFAGDEFNRQVHETKREDDRIVQEHDNVLDNGKTDNKIDSGTSSDSLVKISDSCVSPVNSLVGKTNDEKIISSTNLETVSDFSDKSETMVTQDDNTKLLNDEASQLNQPLEIHVMVGDSKESHGNETLDNVNQLKEQEIMCDNPSEITDSTGVMHQNRHSSDRLHAVIWIGDPIRVFDEKIYYSSCRINGHLYEDVDHVLIRMENNKLIPSKLQAMWEEENTATKWVTAKRCYFPSDLPGAVGRPCSLESSEVYESTCDGTFIAGLIESPCKILPPRKFAEESEKRNPTGVLDDRFPPVYLCKWIYDEAKELFRDISY